MSVDLFSLNIMEISFSQICEHVNLFYFYIIEISFSLISEFC